MCMEEYIRVIHWQLTRPNPFYRRDDLVDRPRAAAFRAVKFPNLYWIRANEMYLELRFSEFMLIPAGLWGSESMQDSEIVCRHMQIRPDFHVWQSPRKALRGGTPGIALGTRNRFWSHWSTFDPGFPQNLGKLTFEIPPRRVLRGSYLTECTN
jgi:hypothetical protein